MKKQYGTLLKAVGEMPDVVETIYKDRDAMTGFIGYLSQNEGEISKFWKATEEVCEYLDKYDFASGYQFDTMQKRIELLHPLRLKLAEMGEAAKKLSAFPDRYGSKKAIEICRNLALTCMERMNLSESEKVSELVGTNTQKLIGLQKLLERDEYILSQINAAIDSEKTVLNKFKAFLAELREYVSCFPHHGADDLSVVKGRISSLKQIDALSGDVGNSVAAIRNYFDRYNKGMVVAKFDNVVREMTRSMRYSDISSFRLQLEDVLKKVRLVSDAFEKESKELKTLKSTLMAKQPEVWKEDNEQLLARVTTILNKDTRKTSFDIGQLKNDLIDAKMKRTNEIDHVVKQYAWLDRNKKYNAVHQRLLAKYLSSHEYHSAVAALKRKRVIRIIMTCIPIVGWFFMPEIK